MAQSLIEIAKFSTFAELSLFYFQILLFSFKCKWNQCEYSANFPWKMRFSLKRAFSNVFESVISPELFQITFDKPFKLWKIFLWNCTSRALLTICQKKNYVCRFLALKLLFFYFANHLLAANRPWFNKIWSIWVIFIFYRKILFFFVPKGRSKFFVLSSNPYFTLWHLTKSTL